jgi:hypothetical protein
MPSGADEQNPPIAFEGFTGLNTDASRPGIKDTEMWWSDGWMPVGDNQLRTMPGVGPPIFAAPSGTQISFFNFGNIGTSPLMVAVLSDGSVWSVNTQTSVSTQVAPPGTLASSARTDVGLSQWGSAYIIVAANQTDGYFLFDGTVFYGAGGIAPPTSAAVRNGGNGYTSVPAVQTVGGSGSGIVLVPVLTEGSVTGLTVVSPGTGYLPGETVQVGFYGGGTDTTPLLQAVLSGGAIVALTLLAGGTGYHNGTFPLAFSGGGGSGATANFICSGGKVTDVQLVSGGTGYTAQPTVSFPGAGGSGAICSPTVASGSVASVNIVNGGTGLRGTPTLSFQGGGGTGATATATVTGGVVTAVTVTAGGTGYGTAPAVVVQSGINDAAYATLSLMPFGIQGAAVETYQSRVWVVNGPAVSYSAPQSVSDFSTSSGGGTFTSNDSFLRASYIQPVQTNGFLYLIGDSSINYISGVTTSGSPPVTSFTNQNADPEVGTPYPATVDVWGSNILFANAFGAHVSYGGKVSKISGPLDGIFNSVPNFGGKQLSAAKAIVFGKKVWALLLPVVDPVTGQQENKLFLWDQKRWWSTRQDVQLTYVQHQEIASVITAYGTDGANVYPLFQQPSVAFTKTVQSKLWARPGGYAAGKAANRAWLLAQYASTAASSFTLSIDNETGSSPVTVTPSGPYTQGVWVMPPQAVSQNGALLGFTVGTNAADMTLVSVSMPPATVQYRG